VGQLDLLTDDPGRAHEVTSCRFNHHCHFITGHVLFRPGATQIPVDPQTKWAIGAKTKPADELKKQLDGGSTVLIIDVRPPANFEKETIPGAINIPLAELESHLKQMSKDTFIVFT
jgi:Rhodanese-like domain